MNHDDNLKFAYRDEIVRLVTPLSSLSMFYWVDRFLAFLCFCEDNDSLIGFKKR